MRLVVGINSIDLDIPLYQSPLGMPRYLFRYGHVVLKGCYEREEAIGHGNGVACWSNDRDVTRGGE